MKRQLTIITVVMLVISLAAPGTRAQDPYEDPDARRESTESSVIDYTAIPAPDYSTPATERPVLFIHGVDGLDFGPADAGTDCLDTWGAMRNKLWDLGWDRQRNKFRYISYYNADTRCSDHYNGDKSQFNTVEHHRSHSVHNGGQGHAGDGHDNDAYLQHLFYHLAWYIYDHFTSAGRIVTVVAHSQGGLLIRYALAKAQHDGADFPKVLYVGQIITMGSAHTGTPWSCDFPFEEVFQAAQQCRDPAYTDAARSFMPWLDVNAGTAQGSAQFETQWTLMGSYADEWVPATSGVGHSTYAGTAYADCNPYRRGCEWYMYPRH